MVSHTTTLRVRWGDVDPAGIVFYPRFLEWYDLAAETLFESLGLEWPTMFGKYGLVGIPIVESGATFLSPVRWGDVISIRAMIAWVKEKTLRMEYEISVGDRLCARGFEVRAWVLRPESPDGPLHAGRIPQEVVERLTETR